MDEREGGGGEERCGMWVRKGKLRGVGEELEGGGS